LCRDERGYALRTDEMAVTYDGGGMTVRRLVATDGVHWEITRTPEATPDAIAGALSVVPNVTGFRMDFPITGELTYEFSCMN
jgi:hypothetical protein